MRTPTVFPPKKTCDDSSRERSSSEFPNGFLCGFTQYILWRGFDFEIILKTTAPKLSDEIAGDFLLEFFGASLEVYLEKFCWNSSKKFQETLVVNFPKTSKFPVKFLDKSGGIHEENLPVENHW